MASYAFKVGEERNKKKEDWRNKGPVVKSKEQINIIKQFLKRQNREEFKNAIAFDRVKLVHYINQMLKTRYAYVFDSFDLKF